MFLITVSSISMLITDSKITGDAEKVRKLYIPAFLIKYYLKYKSEIAV